MRVTGSLLFRKNAGRSGDRGPWRLFLPKLCVPSPSVSILSGYQCRSRSRGAKRCRKSAAYPQVAARTPEVRAIGDRIWTRIFGNGAPSGGAPIELTWEGLVSFMATLCDAHFRTERCDAYFRNCDRSIWPRVITDRAPGARPAPILRGDPGRCRVATCTQSDAISPGSPVTRNPESTISEAASARPGCRRLLPRAHLCAAQSGFDF